MHIMAIASMSRLPFILSHRSTGNESDMLFFTGKPFFCEFKQIKENMSI